MEPIKDVGQIKIHKISHKIVTWRIPNFYNLPQVYDTVIRSPHFKINDRDWYMEVYPNGRRLYSSFGWLGISVLNLNSESPVRNVWIGVAATANVIFTKEESHGGGFYCCTRLIPSSLFNSWTNIFAPEGNLRLYFDIPDDDICSVNQIQFKLRANDVQKLFQSNFENVYVEACVQAEEKNELTMETTVGEVWVDLNGVNWIISNFSDHLQRYDTIFRSPRFSYKDSEWYMEVYPNWRSLYSSLGWFGIDVCNLNSESTLRCITVRIFGETYIIDVKFKADSQNKGFYCCSKLLPTSLFKLWQDVIAPGGKFQLVFLFDDDKDKDITVNRIEIWIFKETMQRWYKQKFENADTFIQASTQTEEETGVEKMRQDLQEIFLNGKFSDIVLKVKSHEFKTHRCILAARSPVFSTILTNDTKVKNTGVVAISDDDPNFFQDFLNYLYTGCVSNLTSENAANLYTMAAKYQVNELKQSCKNFMMMSISIDNFCDVFTASLQHDEKELKYACIQFFGKNSSDIILTCKWQTFYSQNPITGNELFIKCLQLKK